LAFTKKEKSEIMATYESWLGKSQAIFFITYKKMNMKSIDTLRAKVRDTGSELHVVKNTLFVMAMAKHGITVPMMEGTTLAGFAFSDAPALAKVLSDATVKSEIFALKGGYLGAQAISPVQIKALADLPPLPVMRARLLGMLNTPASQLVRTLAEPARQMAYVIKGYSEKDAVPAAA
jgi:large subunit ribosomal protein L10